MAINESQHLKNMDVPAWVLERFRNYVDSIGGRAEFMKQFNIGDSYMSLLWNGKRHPLEELHDAMGIRLVVTPMVYEDLEEKQ